MFLLKRRKKRSDGLGARPAPLPIGHFLSAKRSAQFGAGFTIIESIVVIAISVILTSILIVYSRASEKQVVFFKEQSLLVGAMLRAKAYAIETFQPSLQSSPGFPVNTSALPKICGWGVHIEGDHYIIFHDTPQNGVPCDSFFIGGLTVPNTPEEFETVIVDPRIQISCYALNSAVGQSCSAGATSIDILFVPPAPKVVFSLNSAPDPSALEAVIDLLIPGTLPIQKRTIRVNHGGQVSVN